MVPKLRFKEFCEEWEEKKIGNYVHLKNGLNVDKDKFGQGVPLISVMDILNNDFIVFNNIKGKVDIDSETLKNYSVTYGDILFQRSSETRGDAGKSNVYLDKEKVSTFGGFVIRGKKIGIYNPAFMNSLLKTSNVRKEITSKAQGAQHINISQESLEKVNITLPSLPEQTKIADFLSTVDNKIQNQQDKITHLENIKKGFMQKIFSRKIRFKDDGGEEFPKWEEKRIGEVYIDRNEKTNKKMKLLSVTINNGVIKRSDIEGKDNSSEDKSNYKVVYKGDMVYNSMRMWQGASGISSYYGIVSPAYTVMKSKKEINNVFFAYLFKQPELIFKFRRFSQGLTSDTWNLKYPQIKEIKIKFPCLKEQEKIADFLSSFDQKISTEKETLKHLKQLKKGLLQQMFV